MLAGRLQTPALASAKFQRKKVLPAKATRVTFDSLQLPGATTGATESPGIPGIDQAIEDATQRLSTSVDVISTSAVEATQKIPPEYLLLGGLAVVVVGLLAAFSFSKSGDAERTSGGSAAARNGGPPRKDAVLVFGATGQTGRLLVQKLLASGRTVVAACRSKARADAVLINEMGLRKGLQEKGSGTLVVEPEVDICDETTLTDAVFQGVTQVVMAVGAVYTSDGKGGFSVTDGLTSERVEGSGVRNVAAKAAALLPRPAASQQVVIPAAELTKWDVKDDVIMGGSSSSSVTAAAGEGAAWEGNLVVQGGGFCGIRSPPAKLDLSQYDGLSLRVRGEGQIFKFNVKTAEQAGVPESAYQATFDTVAGEWTTVNMPWSDFVPVKRAKWDPQGAALDPSNIANVGLVLSRFEFNGLPNPSYTEGAFKLEIADGISAFKRPRPSLVLMSSGGVERNAIIGGDQALRATDIPIVRLNPGGTLNWKYRAELDVRASGLPYAVVRSTGLVKTEATEPYTLEMSQGDRISGQVSRGDVAEVLLSALGCSDAVGKTVEIRRSFSVMKPGAPQTLDEAETKRLFLNAGLDRNRWRLGLNPFPEWVAPEGQATTDAAPAKAAQPAESTPASAPKTKSAGVADDSDARRAEVGKWIAGYRSRSRTAPAAKAAAPPPPPAAKAAPAKAAASKAPAASAKSSSTPANVEDAQKWIAKWRASSGSTDSAPADGASASVSEARRWISNWNAKQTGAKVGAGKKELVKAR